MKVYIITVGQAYSTIVGVYENYDDATARADLFDLDENKTNHTSEIVEWDMKTQEQKWMPLRTQDNIWPRFKAIWAERDRVAQKKEGTQKQ